jgi:hypothetical protein
MRISPVELHTLRRHDPFVRAVADRLAALAGDARPGLASAGCLAGGVAVRLAGEGGGFRLSVLHPVDLALTKVVRFEAHDRADIEALARTGTFDAEALLLLGEEAMGDMVGDARFARLNLRDAAGLVALARAAGEEEA